MENNKDEKLYWILSLTFTVLLILSNMIANRLIEVFGMLLPSAVVIFPLTYIIGDVVTEIFGFEKARKLIIVSLLLNCIFVLFGSLAVSLPSPTDAGNVTAYKEVFNVAPRTAIASILGFFAGSIVNSFVMDKMKDEKEVQKSLFFEFSYRQ